MVFSDIFFLFIFLPLFLICYFAASKTNVKNAVLIIFSLFFYSWGEPVWVGLLLLSSVLDYLNGRFIDSHKGTKKAILGVIASCAVDLGILCVFKYSGMIAEGINAVGGLSIPVPQNHMPIGISFYTFQSITYVADVYKGKAKVQKNYFNYLLYLSMFFQLVAGPIVRYSTVAEEINGRQIKISDFHEGMNRLILGLGKKVLIANSVGALASDFLDFNTAPTSVLAAWAGAVMYSLQIYYDFSGYSDMAIGMGLMCGFHFPENFEHPYISKSVTEFWRRWHISLGTFFRDYVYIPLGGNRKHQILNIAVVWFLTGLWHGASWNFVLWGLYFGVLLVIEKKVLLKAFEKIPAFFSHLYLIIAAAVGWVIFYYTDMTMIGRCLGTMFGMGKVPFTDLLTESRLKGDIWLIIAALLLCTPIYGFAAKFGERYSQQAKSKFIFISAVKMIFLSLVLFFSAASLVGDTYNPFLYYRF